jgi:SAM-dependent methyltransferase
MCGDNPNFMDLGEISGEQGREDYQQGWQSFFGSYFKSKSILDVGAGLGLSKKRLETGGNQVMLQDIGPGLDVDFACSIEKIEEVFDVVTCFDVIEHVYEDTKFLESLYNLSKDGVVLTTPNYNVSRCSNKFHIREYTPNGLIQLARDLTDDKIYMWSSIDPHGGSPVEHTEESFNLSMDPVLSIYITK